MRKVYLIMSEQYMPKLEHHSPYGIVDFVFTSRKEAERQMYDIRDMVENGDFYMESIDHPNKHEVEFFRHIESNCFGIVMTMKVNHSNGTYTIYTLQEMELNRGYFKK